MNPLEHALTDPFGDRLPASGTRLEVAPGVFRLRMPLPFALDHIKRWLLRAHWETLIGSSRPHRAIGSRSPWAVATHTRGCPAAAAGLVWVGFGPDAGMHHASPAARSGPP